MASLGKIYPYIVEVVTWIIVRQKLGKLRKGSACL